MFRHVCGDSCFRCMHDIFFVLGVRLMVMTAAMFVHLFVAVSRCIHAHRFVFGVVGIAVVVVVVVVGGGGGGGGGGCVCVCGYVCVGLLARTGPLTKVYRSTYTTYVSRRAFTLASMWGLWSSDENVVHVGE